MPRQKTVIGHIGSVAASVSTTTVCIWAPDTRVKIDAVYLLNGGALTGHATNYGTATLYNAGTAGAGSTSMAARAVDTATTDNVVAKQRWAVTLSGTRANTIAKPGECLYFTWTNAGTGMALTLAKLQIDYTEHNAN
jgi:hypothetical protein